MTDCPEDVGTWTNEEFGKKLYLSLIPLLKTNAKNRETVKDILDILTPMQPYGLEQIAEGKMIQLCSLLLALHMDNAVLVYLILIFLWTCVTGGLLDRIREVKQLLPTIMKVLERHTTVQKIAEICIGFSIKMEYSRHLTQLQLGLQQWPNSDFLKQFASLLNLKLLIPH
jgi:hypothetical protein